MDHMVSSNDLVFNASQWPLEKTHQVVRDSLLDYDGLEWQRTLHDLEKTLDIAYEDVLNDFDLVWFIKGLIVTHSNLSVTWKVKPQIDIISRVPSILRWFSQGGCIFPCKD